MFCPFFLYNIKHNGAWCIITGLWFLTPFLCYPIQRCLFYLQMTVSKMDPDSTGTHKVNANSLKLLCADVRLIDFLQKIDEKIHSTLCLPVKSGGLNTVCLAQHED